MKELKIVSEFELFIKDEIVTNVIKDQVPHVNVQFKDGTIFSFPGKYEQELNKCILFQEV